MISNCTLARLANNTGCFAGPIVYMYLHHFESSRHMGPSDIYTAMKQVAMWALSVNMNIYHYDTGSYVGVVLINVHLYDTGSLVGPSMNEC